MWRTWLVELVVVSTAVAGRVEALATLRAVRQITTPVSSRLVVEFSAPVHYRLQRSAGRPELGVPARLYIDFLDTLPAAALNEAINAPEGPLVRARVTRLDAASVDATSAGALRTGASATRLILDVPGLNDFGAFAMPDPFRVVVDVRGTPRTAPHPVPRPAAIEPRKPPQIAAARIVPPGGVPAPMPPARRIRIVLDPGHGGKDPGARGAQAVAEKDVVLAIAQRLRARLAAIPGIDVILTREADAFLALEERTARANAERADLFVSIHANASPDPSLAGVETYFLNNTNDRATIRLAEMENGLRQLTGRTQPNHDVALILSDLIQSYKVEESMGLAESIQHELVAALAAHGARVNDLGVKRGPFYVLVGAGMPCVLVEVSFITNPQEGRWLAQPDYQDTLAEGLLRGVRRFVENARVAGNL